MRTVTIRDACAVVVDCPHSTPEWTVNGALVFRSPNIRNGRLDLNARSFTTEAQYVERTRRAVPTAGDLIITREAPMGEVAMIPPGVRGCLGQRMVLLRPNPTVMDGRFMLYALMSPSVQHEIHTHEGTGSTVSNLRIPAIEALRLPQPRMTEQQAIASILGALDDKIELNRQMNETLEELARTIFKSWFVDFDPVRAKSEGCQPVGMDAETAELFPSRLVVSDLGEIPEGWCVAPLGDWADALSGGTPAKSNASLWGGDLPWISPKVMTEIHADEAEAWVTDAAVGNGTRLAPSGSTLVMVRGMGLHKCVRVSQARTNVSFNQDVKALVPREVEPTLLLLALLDAQTSLLKRVQSSGHGTGVLPTDILLAHQLCLPLPEVQKRLVPPLDAVNERIAAGRLENRTLADLRDLLLPRLISGELRITEAEKLVGDVP